MIDILLQAGIALLIGGAVAYFWDDIKNWISRVFDAIVATLNSFIEWAVEGIAFIVEEGGKYYKAVQVLVRNKLGHERVEHHVEPISRSDVPSEIKNQLEEGMALLIAKHSF